MKKEFDMTPLKGFPGTDLVYDKQDNGIFEYTLYNNDFSNKRQVNWSGPVNSEIATQLCLDAQGLVEANEKGQLKGELKEIATKLEEDSNPVIMLVKYRK